MNSWNEAKAEISKDDAHKAEVRHQEAAKIADQRIAMKAKAAVTTNSEYEEAKNFQANMFALRDDAAEV